VQTNHAIPLGGASIEDRRSLAAIQTALAERGPLRYLEVGCYLGPTLRSFVADPNCEAITAIDRRDDASDDVRGTVLYPANTTAHMLELLSGVPGANLEKVNAVESSTDEPDPSDFSADLCFIDAEHTDEAVLRDARFARAVLRDRGVLSFHDRTLVGRGILRFLRELPRSHRVYPLKNDLLVIELGIRTLLSHAAVKAQVPRSLWLIADRLHIVPLALQVTSLKPRASLAPAGD
jgi:hypothetical protein